MNQVQKTEGQPSTIKDLLLQKSTTNRLKELMGDKVNSFVSSLMQIVSNNKLLSSATPTTVLNAAITATLLDLPINQNLGFAWIVPYKGQAQFQIGWKGYVQLALRTGIYHRINVVKVHESQFEHYDALKEELVADFSEAGQGEVVGYAAYFRLNNGFEKLVYWTKEEVEAHAKRYSRSFNTSNSPWKENFDEMAMKTVLKNTISKWGIMSIQTQTALISDQSIQEREGEFKYTDNISDDTVIDNLNSEIDATDVEVESNDEDLI